MVLLSPSSMLTLCSPRPMVGAWFTRGPAVVSPVDLTVSWPSWAGSFSGLSETSQFQSVMPASARKGRIAMRKGRFAMITPRDKGRAQREIKLCPRHYNLNEPSIPRPFDPLSQKPFLRKEVWMTISGRSPRTTMVKGTVRSKPAQSAIAGVVGGLMMAAYASAAMGVTGRGFFTPLNLIAALFPPYRPVVSGFHPLAAVIGMLLHLAVSVSWGAALGWLAARVFPNLFRGAWSQLAVGLTLGITSWAVTGLRLGPDLDPALKMMPA